MTYRGHVVNGTIVLESDAKLPNGTVVRVAPFGAKKQRTAKKPDPLAKIAELAFDAGIRDLSMNADHYLYGHPKVSHARKRRVS
ncbi:MAG: hypothetical protein HY291_06425 [Planctomycetes bacterium]|nr:hypothetical protein [Planctomycetota bacterium]